MDKFRRALPAIAVGMILGVAGAHTLTVSTLEPAAASEGGAWTSYHSAIPARDEVEPSPTF